MSTSKLALVLVVGCGFPHPDRYADSGTVDPDAHVDAMPVPRCAQWTPFATPQVMQDLVSPELAAMGPSLSNDRLDLLFSQDLLLVEATRVDEASPWVAKVAAGLQNTTDVVAATFVGDRLHILYVEGNTLYSTSRTATDAPFTAPGEIFLNPAGPAALTADGTLLVYEAVDGSMRGLDYVRYDPVTHDVVDSGSLIHEPDFNNEAPAIGEHDHTLVWSRSATGAVPATLVSAELTGTTVGPRQDLMLDPTGTYYDSGPSLTEDGTQLIYTSGRIGMFDDQQLYATQRTCNAYE